MSTETIEISRVLPATPERLYRAWMTASEHAEFTGAPATIEPIEGGDFDAWDGYITGTTLELQPARLIIQAWRTTEFPEDAPDSRLEVSLEAVEGGTRVTIRHTEIPEGQGEAYRQGWGEHYLDRLQEYFGNPVEERPVTNEEIPLPGAPVSGEPQAAAAATPTPTPPDAAQAPIPAPAEALASAVAPPPAAEPAPRRKAAAKRKPAKKAKKAKAKAKRPAKKAKAKKRAPAARKASKKKPTRRGAKRR